MTFTLDRRTLLQILAATPVAFCVPGVYAGPNTRTRPVVLIELKGGNDGLNTVVPFTESRYYDLRPSLAIGRNQALQVSQKYGLHPSLVKTRKLFSQDELAIVLGVGYNAPNRSHFRSIEIWETGTDSHEYSHSGWLDAVAPKGKAGPDTLVFGDGAGPMLGGRLNSVALSKTSDFVRKAKRLKPAPRVRGANEAMAHLLSTHQSIIESADVLGNLNANVARSDFPSGKFGQQLHEVARLILAGAPSVAYRVSLGGFDTHAGQLGTHQRLLKTLDDGIGALANVLKKAGLWDDTLIMTYSEFGRRAAENGSGGTDHGTAAPHFVLGGRVKGGLYGKQPSLKKLNDRDMVYSTDYRRLYATVVQKHWGLKRHFGEHKALGFL